MNITLYGLTSYDRSSKVRWLLEEMGVEYKDVWLNREKKEHEHPNYLKINPLGRVPAVEIDGQVVLESGAICTMLADKFPDKKMSPQVSSPERGKFLQWMFMSEASVAPFNSKIMIIEDIPPGEVFQAKENALRTEVRDFAEFLNSVLSKQEYLLASGFSAADICMSYQLYIACLWPEMSSIINDFPSLTNYLERVQKRPAAIKANVFSYKE